MPEPVLPPQPHPAPLSTPIAWHKAIRGTLWAVGILFVLDALILGQGAFSFLGAVIILPVSLVRGFRSKNPARLLWLRALLPIALVLATWATIFVNLKVAESRAKRVISACEAFATDHGGAYPHDLRELVPRYLSDVPDAKYTLLANKFYYFEHQNQHTLLYVAIPPFGRRTYDLERKRPGYLD
jgi:hypothetical protein